MSLLFSSLFLRVGKLIEQWFMLCSMNALEKGPSFVGCPLCEWVHSSQQTIFSLHLKDGFLVYLDFAKIRHPIEMTQ